MRRDVTPPFVDAGPLRPTRPWRMIADRYREVPAMEPMAQLAEHIAGAPYADRIFGDTSMFTLVVAQTPQIATFQEVLRVDLSDGRFVLAVQERGLGLDLRPGDHVRRVEVGDGIAAFERLLRAKRWD